MEALQRSVLSTNWITLIFVFSLTVLFFLKLFKTAKLKGYASAIFYKGFLEIEVEDGYSPVTFFHIGFSFFSFLMLSITTFFLINQYKQSNVVLFADYFVSSYYVFIFMIVRSLAAFLLLLLFEVKKQLSFFMISKRGYLYSISIGLLFLNVFYFYSFQNQFFLFSGFVLLFLVRFLLILINNKNLIIKELFYFILYICAFELAPLFVLFRLIF
jgi:hypothetical protein